MNGQLRQSNSAPARRARRTIDISATTAVVGVAIAIGLLSAGEGAGTRTAHATAATATFSRLSAIPSHNGLYRASLEPRAGSTWTVRVETAAGAPVDDAVLSLESWMPDDDRVAALHPRVTGSAGEGRYHVEGLRLDRRGWWNVRLQVARPGATDSLAFNLVR